MALTDSPLPAVECQASGRGVTSSAIGFDRDGLDIEEEQDSGAGELPPDPADSGQDRGPLGVSAAERALDATESEPHSEGGWSAIRTMAARWSEVKHGGGYGKAGSCRRIGRSRRGLRFPPPSEPRLAQALARRPPTAIRHQDPIIVGTRITGRAEIGHRSALGPCGSLSPPLPCRGRGRRKPPYAKLKARSPEV